MTGLIPSVAKLVADTRASVPPQLHGLLDEVTNHLDSPLKVAVAGAVNSGKSTLVNTLIGEPLALTDATETTRLVTTYRDGPAYSVHAILHSGEQVEVDFRRDRAGFHLDLASLSSSDISSIDVRVPSQRLRALSLVDTPGLGSPSTDLAQRTLTFLSTDSNVPPVDAVLYLIRHRHANDDNFLADFHAGSGVSGVASVIGVLSRADEVGNATTDAMQTASIVAQQCSADPRLARICQLVVPISGLLAQGASQLRERDVAALRQIADGDPLDLVSADRFVNGGDEREPLLRSLGLFGVRKAVELIKNEAVADAAGLAQALHAESGIAAIIDLVTDRFGRRREVLKAQAALSALDNIADTAQVAGLRAGIEELRTNAHELVEVALLDQLRDGTHEIDATDQAAIEQILGARGVTPTERLGLPTEASADDIRAAAAATADRWRRAESDPFRSRAQAPLLAAAVRSAEGLYR